MSYKTNINKIDFEVKSIFKSAKLNNNNHQKLYIYCGEPQLEGVNSNIEMNIFVSQRNLNGDNPIVEWGYYPNVNDMTNEVKYTTPISSISTIIDTVLKEGRMSKVYLESLDNDDMVAINEEIEITTDIDNIRDTYTLGSNAISLDISKLLSFLNKKYGIKADYTSCHYDTISGKKRGMFLDDNPRLGDYFEVTLSDVEGHGNISVSTWLNIENDLSKIQFVETVSVNTYNYSITFDFSEKVFAEIV